MRAIWPAELESAARESIASWELESWTDLILSAVEPCICLNHSHKSSDTVAHTFGGGFPELAPELEWPTYKGKLLPFIAQVDFASLPALPSFALPKSGFAYFFYWCTNEKTLADEVPWKVLWAECDPAALKTTEVSESEILPDWRGIRVYDQERTSSISLRLSLSVERLEQIALESGQISEADLENEFFGDFPESFESDVELELAGGEIHGGEGAWGQLFGFAQLETQSTLVPTRLGYQIGNETWLNLLEVGSMGNSMWSDEGYLNFFIRQSDLQNREFRSVRAQVLSH